MNTTKIYTKQDTHTKKEKKKILLMSQSKCIKIVRPLFAFLAFTESHNISMDHFGENLKLGRVKVGDRA